MSAPTADDRFRAIVESQSEFVSLARPDGTLVYVNPACARQFGRAQAELVGTSRLEPVLPLDHPVTRALIDGREFRVAWSNHRHAEAPQTRAHSAGREVSAERLARRGIKRRSDVLRAVTEAIPTTVVVIDSAGRHRFVMGAFEARCGPPRAQILGRIAAEVTGADEVARRRPFMQRAFAGQTVETTLDCTGPDGPTCLAQSRVRLKLEDMVDGFVGISRDITRQRREEQRLTHLAQPDALTGLLNRAGFELEVERQLGHGDASRLGLLDVDLDRFKPVDDAHGHLIGGHVLRLLAQRVQPVVRDTDRAARVGGDEFAVLLPGVRERGHLRRVAEEVLLAARVWFEIDGQPIAIGAGIGVAFGVEEDGSWQDLPARADAMPYRAKQGGRGRQPGAGDAAEAP